jgi:hypothetical protein
MATVNAVAQLLVPPPKYHVETLIPRVRFIQKACLAGLFIIERGGRGERVPGNDEALDILLRNCEDAYGFPPYRSLEPFLKGIDLGERERQIIAQAFAGCPTTLLRSESLDWAARIPSFITAHGAA